MLLSDRRQRKLKKLQDARRAYIEQLAFIRQFRKDEDGGLIVLTLLLLISMLVVGGMAVDFMRFESERTKLQSVADRAVLAAANLNQDRDPQQLITDFFAAEGYAGAIVGTPDIDKNATGATITLDSRVDVDTFYLRLIGMDTLSAPASASAIQGTGNVEVSLVLDISGSMGRSMTGEAYVIDPISGDPVRDAEGNIVTETRTETRMFFLQQAANQFVEDLLLPEYEDRISINLIAYSQHVSIGDRLYGALRTTPDMMRADGTLGARFGLTDGYASPAPYSWVDADGNPTTEGADGATLQDPYASPIDLTWADGQEVVRNPSRCVVFEDDEFNTTTFDINRTYMQVEHVDFYSNDWTFRDGYEPCPAQDFQGIIMLSQDVDELQGAISQYIPTLNTSIHRGMKWGVSLLDESMRPLLAGIPTIDPAFRGTRPVDNDTTTTSKYVVIMTDGETVSSRRVRRAGYGDSVDYYNEFDEWKGFAEMSGRRYAANDGNDSTTFWNMTTSIGTTTDLNNKLASICTQAAQEFTEVYTISMGVFNQTMRDCASEPGNAFQSTITNDPDQPGLGEIFGTISDQITALRLSL